MAGRGMPADPAEAIKWHIVAKAGGASDPDLDMFASKQSAEGARRRREGSQEVAGDRAAAFVIAIARHVAMTVPHALPVHPLGPLGRRRVSLGI